MDPDPSIENMDGSTRPPTLRYKATIAYDGSRFHGWQKQQPPDGTAIRTVAGVVERCIAESLKQPIHLVGASRTDAGVHARGQVAHFDAASRIPLPRMAMAFNARLPDDIEVRSVEVAPPGFDAIAQARSKQYRYRIHHASRRPLEKRHHVWHCWLDLDLEEMNAAAARLVGEHDFAAFAAAGHGRTTTVRTIHRCDVSRDPASDEVHIVVEGNGFLYNMVRIIAGTLVEVGRGHWTPDRIPAILASRDRAQAGPTLPPTGLWLEWVRYDDDPLATVPPVAGAPASDH